MSGRGGDGYSIQARIVVERLSCVRVVRITCIDSKNQSARYELPINAAPVTVACGASSI